MKAMVLAAGLGTRMRPLTLLRAKPALPVLNRPLVHWTLQALRRAGVREVVINTHHRPASVRAAVGDGRRLGLRVLYSHEPRLLGSIGGVRKLRAFFGDEPFLLVNGDMVFDFDLRRLVQAQRASGALAAVSLQAHPRRGRYGSVIADARGRVLAFGGHPGPARGHAWHFTGVHVLDPSLLDRLKRGYSETARDLYGPLIAEGGLILGVPHGGPWYDLSSPGLYLASQLALLRSGFGGARGGAAVHPRAHVDPEARVRRSVVGEGAVVGPGAVVEDSVLWEGARVGAGARVLRSILANRVRIDAGESLVGRIAVPDRRSTASAGPRRGGRREVEVGA